MKILLLVALAALAWFKGSKFFAQFWLAFAEPALKKVNAKAKDVVASDVAQGTLETPLTPEQAREVRK